MRKLGQLLGFEAMSLYNHVANKDDLLDGILDLVLAEIEPPAAGGDWEAAVREQRDLRSRRSPAPPLGVRAADGARPHPARAAALHGLAARAAARAGFSAETTYHAYHVLDGHIFGFSLWEPATPYSPEEASS